MTKIGMSLGGTSAPTGTQISAARAPVDWTQQQYATPHPAGKRVFGRHVEPKIVAPQLTQRMVRVRSKAPAVVYADDGSPIPSDQFEAVPISPRILEAIKAGDLERGKDPEPEQPPRRVHMKPATPPPASTD